MGLAAAAMIGELSGFLLLLIFYCRSRREGKASASEMAGTSAVAKAPVSTVGMVSKLIATPENCPCATAVLPTVYSDYLGVQSAHYPDSLFVWRWTVQAAVSN